jgi:hypothetical protein
MVESTAEKQCLKVVKKKMDLLLVKIVYLKNNK